MKNVVILGGGTAGTMAANKLRAAVPSDELSITVVDRDDVHHYQPGYLFVPFGGYDTSDIVRSRHNFIHDGVQLTLSEIDRVDAEANTVHLVAADGVEDWPRMTKAEVAARLADRVVRHFAGN